PSGSGASFSFTPSMPGTYIVTLQATDKDGLSNTTTQTINVADTAPTVSIDNAPASSNEGSPISLTGHATSPGLEAISLSWHVVASNGQVIADFPTGPVAPAPGDTSPPGVSVSSTFPTFTPVDNGDYTVTLTATDNFGGASSASAVIHVVNVAPTPVITG